MKDSHIKWVYFGMLSVAASQFYFVLQLIAALLILSIVIVAVVIFLSFCTVPDSERLGKVG